MKKVVMRFVRGAIKLAILGGLVSCHPSSTPSDDQSTTAKPADSDSLIRQGHIKIGVDENGSDVYFHNDKPINEIGTWADVGFSITTEAKNPSVSFWRETMWYNGNCAEGQIAKFHGLGRDWDRVHLAPIDVEEGPAQQPSDQFERIAFQKACRNKKP